MKYSELVNKSIKELEELVAEYRAELFSLRFKNATRQLDKTHRIDIIRKSIARALTALNQKTTNEYLNDIKKVAELKETKKTLVEKPKKVEVKEEKPKTSEPKLDKKATVAKKETPKVERQQKETKEESSKPTVKKQTTTKTTKKEVKPEAKKQATTKKGDK